VLPTTNSNKALVGVSSLSGSERSKKHSQGSRVLVTASAPETVAVFTRFNKADGSSTKVTGNNLHSPEARFPIRQMTSRPDTEQSDGSATEGSRWRPSASISLTVTPVASNGPSFVMVYSKVIRSPAVDEAKTSLSEIIMSGMSRTVVLSSAVATESQGSAPSPY